MLLCVSGTKGAPGATTVALGLARLASLTRRTLLVEADPQGGSIAARFGRAPEPGLATLAASGRHAISSRLLAQNLQAESENLELLLAPSSPSHVRGALRAIGERLASELSSDDTADDAVAIADLGRLEDESPARTLADAADRVVFVTHPTLEGADALFVRTTELLELRDKAMVMTVGEAPPRTYESTEVSAVLGVPLAASLPFDPVGAASVWSRRDLGKVRRRGLLLALAGAAERLGIDTPRPERPPTRSHRLAHSTAREPSSTEAVT